MKNLRTTVSEEAFAALEAEAIAQGKTLSAHVRRLLESAVSGGASPSTEPLADTVSKHARVINNLRRRVEELEAKTG